MVSYSGRELVMRVVSSVFAVWCLLLASQAAVAGVVWESGTVSGHVDGVTHTSTGTFVFDAGDADCAGVDYSAATSTPGTYSVAFSSGTTGTWTGTFTAGGGSLVFGATNGTFHRATSRLDLEGPITFNATPALSLTGLRFFARTTTSNPTGASYDFSGPFELTAAGGSVVIPNTNTTVEGDTANAFPFHIGYYALPSMRYQQVYAASEFTCPGVERIITKVAFRPDAIVGYPFSTTLANVGIAMSTTVLPPDALHISFSANEGDDATQVHSGSLPLSSAFTGGPSRDFDIEIPLQNSFVYDPTRGNLLLDVANFADGVSAFFDAVSGSADPVSRVYASDVNAATGSTDTVGLVTKLEFRFHDAFVLDFGVVQGVAPVGGVLSVLGGGASAGFTLDLFDPVVTSILSARATATIGTATFSPLPGGPLVQDTLPVGGFLKYCALFPDCSVYLPLPFTQGGTAGVGLGGTVTANTFSVGPGLRVTLQGAPWTLGVASVSGVATPSGGTTTSKFKGFAHGPVSLTASALSASGLLQFVTPARLDANYSSIDDVPLFGVVRVHVVPEPEMALLLGTGIAALVLLGRKRMRA
jgi:hypothetical protein